MKLCISIIFWMVTSCHSQVASECDKVKTGKYYYYSKHTREKVIIDRTDSVQKEWDASGNPPIISKLVWKGGCKYEMYLNAMNISKLTGTDSLIATIPAQVDIVHVNDSFYICVAKIAFRDIKAELRDTMYFLR